MFRVFQFLKDIVLFKHPSPHRNHGTRHATTADADIDANTDAEVFSSTDTMVHRAAPRSFVSRRSHPTVKAIATKDAAPPRRYHHRRQKAKSLPALKHCVSAASVSVGVVAGHPSTGSRLTNPVFFETGENVMTATLEVYQDDVAVDAGMASHDTALENPVPVDEASQMTNETSLEADNEEDSRWSESDAETASESMATMRTPKVKTSDVPTALSPAHRAPVKRSQWTEKCFQNYSLSHRPARLRLPHESSDEESSVKAPHGPSRVNKIFRSNMFGSPPATFQRASSPRVALQTPKRVSPSSSMVSDLSQSTQQRLRPGKRHANDNSPLYTEPSSSNGSSPQSHQRKRRLICGIRPQDSDLTNAKTSGPKIPRDRHSPTDAPIKFSSKKPRTYGIFASPIHLSNDVSSPLTAFQPRIFHESPSLLPSHGNHPDSPRQIRPSSPLSRHPDDNGTDNLVQAFSAGWFAEQNRAFEKVSDDEDAKTEVFLSDSDDDIFMPGGLGLVTAAVEDDHHLQVSPPTNLRRKRTAQLSLDDEYGDNKKRKEEDESDCSNDEPDTGDRSEITENYDVNAMLRNFDHTLKVSSSKHSATSVSSEPGDSSSFMTKLREEFVVGDKIATGGFGEIYKITSRKTGEVKALKRIPAPQEDDIRTTRREMDLHLEMSSHSHPHIVKVHRVSFDEDALCGYMVMDYCRRGDLCDLEQAFLDAKVTMSEDLIMTIFSQILVAVHSCHHATPRGILHCDLKSSNVFLDDDQVFLGDFGFASYLDEPRQPLGLNATMEYTAPEAFDHLYDEKFDMWSLGAILFEIRFLRNLFENKVDDDDDTVAGVRKMLSHIKEVLADERPKWQTSGDLISRLLLQLLMVEPISRPTSSQLIEDPEIRKFLIDPPPLRKLIPFNVRKKHTHFGDSDTSSPLNSPPAPPITPSHRPSSPSPLPQQPPHISPTALASKYTPHMRSGSYLVPGPERVSLVSSRSHSLFSPVAPASIEK